MLHVLKLGAYTYFFIYMYTHTYSKAWKKARNQFVNQNMGQCIYDWGVLFLIIGSKNIWSSHLFSHQWKFFQGKKKAYFCFLRYKRLYLNFSTFRWSSWRRYDGFGLSYKSQLWQHSESINSNKLLYKKNLQSQNTTVCIMDSQFWKNTVRISHLSAQWLLLLQNLSRYMQLIILPIYILFSNRHIDGKIWSYY